MTIYDIKLLAVALTLVVQSYWDLRYKKIPLLVTLLSGIIGMGLSVLDQREWIDVLYAVVPGLVCIGIGRITRQAIGYGDGFLLCAMGFHVSFEVILSVGMMAIILGGVVALAGLVFRKIRGKDELPFVPFLFVAWIGYILMEKGILV